jgi:hypothetical protein
MKIFMMIKACLNETYSKAACIYLSDAFPIQNGLKQGHSLPQLLLNFVLYVPLGRSKKGKGTGT